MGVALSIFNTITKMFNVPLLSVTTSAVASALGSSSRAAAAAAGKSGAGAAAGAGAAMEEKLGAEAGAEAAPGAAVGEEGQPQSTRRRDTAAAKAQVSLDALSDAACASIGIAIAVGLVQVRSHLCGVSGGRSNVQFRLLSSLVRQMSSSPLPSLHNPSQPFTPHPLPVTPSFIISLYPCIWCCCGRRAPLRCPSGASS